VTRSSAGSPHRAHARKKRKPSSKRWLERQHRDPYVAGARLQGYRSRAAFKLIELDDRFGLLRPGARVLDLGAAPGGWTQVAVQRTGADRRRETHIVALDLLSIDPIGGAVIVQADAADGVAASTVTDLLGAGVDLVLSDMAPNTTGHRGADHLRIVALAEIALEVAVEVLAPGGAFVCKVWQGGSEAGLLARIKRLFADVRHAKPPASRADSAEVYLIARGFRGRQAGTDRAPA
jgi:23S rRNA (uridine2552-2'-O)-methyltransferase